MNNIPVHIANTDREFARMTFALDVKLFILRETDFGYYYT